ncbi:MAG: hypothetical protein N4A53_03295 [Pelagimonas sp.]|jgi:hypothetical protein|nr:hypothetical protein [Pelagimonas sp.]
MDIGYSTALPITRLPGRGAAQVQEATTVINAKHKAVPPPPVPVNAQMLPSQMGTRIPAATAQAASAYKAAKGAVTPD